VDVIKFIRQASVKVTSSNHCLKASHRTCGNELMSLRII